MNKIFFATNDLLAMSCLTLEEYEENLIEIEKDKQGEFMITKNYSRTSAVGCSAYHEKQEKVKFSEIKFKKIQNQLNCQKPVCNGTCKGCGNG